MIYLFFEEVTQSRKTREWERRLFRGFHVAPAAGDDTILLNVQMEGGEDGERRVSETGADKFKRMARLALLNRERLARPPKHLSHIGRSTSNESFKSRTSLKQAMDAAKKIVNKKTQGGGGGDGENPSTSGLQAPSGSGTEENLDSKDHRSGSGSTMSADRKDSTLSMVAEGVTSATPTPSASFGEIDGDGDEEQEGAGQVSLMDEPLPEIMSTVKATSPQQKVKAALPPPPKSLDKDKLSPSPSTSAKVREELGRVSDKLGALPTVVASDTISVENETRSVDSPLRASSRLSAKSDQQSSTTPSGSPLSTQQKLSRLDTFDIQESVSVRVKPPTTTENEKVPSINVKQEVIISPATLPISTKSTAPTVNIVASASPPSLTVDSSPQPSTSSTSTLQIIGQSVDDVKTIKRSKPGGSWF